MVRLMCISWSKVYFKWTCATGRILFHLGSSLISTKDGYDMINLLLSSSSRRRMWDTKLVVSTITIHTGSLVLHLCIVKAKSSLCCCVISSPWQQMSRLIDRTTQNHGQCWVSVHTGLHLHQLFSGVKVQWLP